MKCHRCGSVMVYERFYGLDEQFSGWRCVLCGEIIDQVILENRQTGLVGRQEWQKGWSELTSEPPGKHLATYAFENMEKKGGKEWQKIL